MRGAVSALRQDAARVLGSWVAPDPHQDRLRRDFWSHVDTHHDALSRACAGAHLTAGALVLSADGARVLLTLHAKARRWFHLGGHCEPQDLSLAGAAQREATEESGIAGLVLDPVPVQLDEHTVGFCGPHEQVRHLDVRFLAVAPAQAAPTVSAESLDVRWWPVEDLPTDAPDISALVRRGLSRAAQRPSVLSGASSSIAAAPASEHSGGSASSPS